MVFCCLSPIKDILILNKTQEVLDLADKNVLELREHFSLV